MGGDFYRKGGDLLLEWAETTKLDGWQLHLVTRDPVTTTSARVHIHQGLTPNSPELRRLYQQADLFALPTRAGRLRMGVAARQDVEARHDLRDNALRTVEIFRAVVGSNPAST